MSSLLLLLNQNSPLLRYTSYLNLVDARQYGAKGDAVSLSDCTVASDGRTISSPSRLFVSYDQGKSCYVYGSSTEYKIESVTDGYAYLDSSCGVSGTNKRVLFGTDDTASIQTAMDAAASLVLTIPQMGDGSDPVSWGGIPVGGTVALGNGGWLVKNTQERYETGYGGAITINRHCGLVGAGHGQTAIYIAPGNYGHSVCNKGALDGYGDELVVVNGFSIFCNRDQQDSTCMDGLHFSTNLSGSRYSNVDCYSSFSDIVINQPYRYGVYTYGRGENNFEKIWVMNSGQYGYYMLSQDTRVNHCNAGGCFYSGFYLKCASSQITSCKAFYNGSGGGTDYGKSANWHISDGGHSYRMPVMMLNGCESQEARGSGFYIAGGLTVFSGCKSTDEKRTVLAGSSALPDICAGFHLDANASYNVFDGCYTHPNIQMDWSGDDHKGGDYAVYIAEGCVGNKGNIYTQDTTIYDVAKIGGTGTTDATNCLLRIDSENLRGVAPDAPIIDYVRYQSDGSTYAALSEGASDGGRAVRYCRLYAKLHADSDYTLISTTDDVETVALTDLVYGSEYDFKATAENAEGVSEDSEVTTYTITTTVPDAPTGLYGLVMDASIGAGWVAPEYDGGSAITDYIIETSISGADTWSVFADGTSTSTYVDITGLTNDQAYDIRVAAVNAVGQSAYSDLITRTPSASAGSLITENTTAYYDASSIASITATGSLVTAWSDSSGSGAGDITQSNTAYSPSSGKNTINGQNVITFDGATSVMNLPAAVYGLAATTNYTLYFVFGVSTARLAQTNALIYGSENFLLYARGNVTDVIAKNGTSAGAEANGITYDTDTHIVVMRREGTALNVFYDGSVSNGVSTAEDVSISSAYLGLVNLYYGFFGGDLAAILVDEEASSYATINAKAAILAAKWGISTWEDLSE